MDAKDLKVFQAVARTRGMNSAADILNTVQSNVTARIRALEQELAVKLVDRHSRGGRRNAPRAAYNRIPGDHCGAKVVSDYHCLWYAISRRRSGTENRNQCSACRSGRCIGT